MLAVLQLLLVTLGPAVYANMLGRLALFTALLGVCLCQTPLDDYVNLPEPAYAYTALGSFRDEDRGLTVYHINMTSLTWFDETYSSQPEWFHYMAVCVPDNLVYDSHGVMMISWGNNDDDLPTPDNDDYLPLVMDMASQAGIVATLLNQVPNQPILFPGDPEQDIRSEDDLIAYTIKEFAQSNREDPSMFALFPMAKSAIKGMDTIQDFASTNLGLNIEHFALAGGSKRAWTTYLAAATDPQQRVFGMVPLVFSIVNFEENLMKHYQSLGGWSWAMAPYHEEGLAGGIANPDFPEYSVIADPYVFMERYTFPVMVVGGTGDEFFFPHESKGFFNDFPGQKYFLMLENTQHFLVGHHERLVRNIVTFVSSIIDGHTLPSLSWSESIEGTTGTLTLNTDTTPVSVTAWSATTTSMTEGRRDYRMLVAGGPVGIVPNPILWTSEPVTETEPGVYTVTHEQPETGYRGAYMTIMVEVFDGHFFEATTEVMNLPDTFPFEECTTVEQCQGEMV